MHEYAPSIRQILVVLQDGRACGRSKNAEAPYARQTWGLRIHFSLNCGSPDEIAKAEALFRSSSLQSQLRHRFLCFILLKDMTKHHLTLRPNFIGNTKLQDDYIVRRDLRPVGRIHLVNEGGASDQLWEWGTNLPLATRWWCIGRTSSLEGAKIAFLEAWTRLYDSLAAEQIAHWHEQQDAAAGRAIKLRDRAQPDDAAQAGESEKRILDGSESQAE